MSYPQGKSYNDDEGGWYVLSLTPFVKAAKTEVRRPPALVVRDRRKESPWGWVSGGKL